MSLVELWIFL